MKQLTFEEWEKTYQPIRNLDTYDSEIDRINPLNLWTVRDAEGSRIVLTNGYGYVDRLEYVECAVPWNDGETFTVQDN